ncbi:MAG TPA: hypothetical protein VNX21_03235 [Candidatus Thermoplasmatota archaeon]|nr:hypothetical protein [Candidatus Thermoplasmatota archaeon]
MLRRLVPCLLVLALLAPGALAFASPRDEVAIAYDANRAPLALAAGEVAVKGAFRVGVLGALLEDSRIGPIPRVIVGEQRAGVPSFTEASDVTLVLHDGSLLWMLEDASVPMTAGAPYAFALGLPRSPFDEEGAAPSPAVVLAGPQVRADLEWQGGETDLVPLDATVSLLGPDGQPVAGFDRRRVNADLDATRARSGADGVVFRASGAFPARLVGQGIGGGLGASAADLRIDVDRADDDRFTETVAALDAAMSMFSGGQASGLSGPGSPVGQLEALSGFLNGALVLLPPPGGDGEEPPAPRTSRIGGQDVDAGPFTVLRSEDLALAWGDDEMRVDGTSSVSITSSGLRAEAPLTVGPVPILSVLLWLGAAAAVAYFFVRRPPASKGKVTHRVASTAVYAVALVITFILWDMSFAETFGTSVLQLLREKGFSAQSYSQFALVFGLEMIPWSLAALLFALPVRIALGVLLRYRGQGSSYKGVAKAGGLVALAVLGPIYALWIVNVLVQQLLKAVPAMFG